MIAPRDRSVGLRLALAARLQGRGDRGRDLDLRVGIGEVGVEKDDLRLWVPEAVSKASWRDGRPAGRTYG